MATSESPSFQRGWVLHRRPYRNSSLILDLFCVKLGRVSAVIRGGQRNPLLQSFQPLQLQLRGRNELRTLMAVEA
ncbi:MAG: DNA repair protein RecO, partial [Gammaproteobacteria bacterium HGW-Gammaproteobacteria-14]